MYFRQKKLPYVLAAILASSIALVGCDDGDDGAAGAPGEQGPQGEEGPQGPAGPSGDGSGGTVLKRLMTAPLGAEFTGMFLNTDGAFLANVQHPSSSNSTADADGKVFNLGTVGVVLGADFNSLGVVEELDLPITTEEKELVLSAVGSYTVLTQQSDSLADGTNMGDIIAADGTTLIKSSNDPDFNGVVSDGGTGYYLYTNWEDRPGSMSRIRLSSGYAPTLEGMLDFSSVNGTWVNCFGTVSPWGTPLTSEELYFDETSDWYNPNYSYFSDPQAIASYLGHPTDGSGAWGNPYDYGYIVEIGVDGTVAAADEADVKINKLELLGRFSHENPVVMPDQRTVFLSDDGGSVVFFKFVADSAGDMSSGTLYAAKVTQATGINSAAEAAFAVEWVELGSGAENVIEAAIRDYDGTLAEAKLIPDAEIASYAAGNNPYNDDRIAFLESRKTAAALGATAEWNKMEGVNINYGLASNWWNSGAANGAQAYMYMAMSDVTGAMSDGAGDIDVEANRCGVVYRMKLIKNADGLVDIDKLVPAIAGGPYDSSVAENQCSVNSISNPDNLVILGDGRVLIGEDTGRHENNVIWLFNDPSL